MTHQSHTLYQSSLFYPSQSRSLPQSDRTMNKSGNKQRTLLNIPYNERDIQLIYKVFVKKYLTTLQIWHLFFRHTKHMKVCQERLRKLREYGLLRSIEVAHKRGTPRPHLLW